MKEAFEQWAARLTPWFLSHGIKILIIVGGAYIINLAAKKFIDKAGIKYQQLPDNYFVFDITGFNKNEIDNVIELEVQ